jgi:tetratricopeptide (TPR) repeat protein
MFGDFYERLAAWKNPRFQMFVEAKDAYLSFIHESRVRFDEMTNDNYRHAQEDTRLIAAALKFNTAIEMSEREGALADVAVAKYQLGLIRHARGEFDEAKALIETALKVMSSLPLRNSAADISCCHYHLGVIALKQGRLPDAVRELRRARQIDEANIDLGGMQLCDLALAACADAGFDIKAIASPSPADADGWEVADDETEVSAEEEAPIELETDSGSIRFNQRELIWLASYSVQANDALMAHLNSLGDEFGRPVGVSRVAFGAAEPERRNLRRPESDQHLCAAILVLEKAGLRDPAFHELAFACMRRVLDAPDFRLLVYLHDLTIDELRELADQEPLVATLFDTTQIAQLPSLEQLRRTLVPYVRHVEHIRASAHWRDLRLRLASVCGSLATAILFAAALLSLLGFSAVLLKMELARLGPHAPKLASLVFGILAFPLQAPLLYLLLRGMHATVLAPRDHASLNRWIVACTVIMVGANHFQHALHGPYSWLYLGLAVGVLLDSISRAGRRAKRQMIDLEELMKHAADPALQDARETVLRGDALNPFSCPLLPALSARVFISYTRSSVKISKLAGILHRGLKEVGASPFLDRINIPSGASWRRSLNEHLGECDTFLCILDEKGVQRKWIAAELLAAIEARRLTGTPEIVILTDPAIQHGSHDMLPIFRGVVSAASEPPVQGRPQILQLNQQTKSSLFWGLSPGQFVPASVFTLTAALPIMYAMIWLRPIGGLGLLAGFILGFLTMLERMGRFPLTSGLADRGWLEPITLLSAFWIGYMTRATIAWAYEREHGQETGAIIPAISVVGLTGAFIVFIPRGSVLSVGWSLVLAVAGWMMVAAVMRIGVKEQRAKGA